MDKEPLEAQSTEQWTLDQLLERSLQEMRKSLGVPQVVEADKPKPVTDSIETSKDAKGDVNA